ncbi:PE-PPE domain-containing protein [Gordonia soli]|uniref:PE-PPE domain-containing protein n=1 Tax=Gordonia soli NBRC 108243 TaxID=1223545 RepID=M0QEL9_9ACTN|nr:PE-PPE domain-containing protein [Gordonia soli]GAC67048.1 hypothetical protein GS4_05_02610 [Gordonia soli NBRC 108243]
MRRILLSLTVFVVALGLFFQPGFMSGTAHALQIGPIKFPDIDPPVTVSPRPTIVERPQWMPELSAARGDTVVLIPGTTDYDGEDQLNRTRDIGMFGKETTDRPAIKVVDYPAAFGFTIGDFPIYLAGDGTFNDSVEIGTAKGVAAAEAAYDPNKPGQKIVINGYSQSAPIAMNVAYMLKQRGTIPEDQIVVVTGADSRFPNTGVENVVPSFIPGMYTNGDRNPADTGDIRVESYCVRGDATCGVGNPFADPFSTFFYLVPGFYVHAFLTYRINEYDIEKQWMSDTGNTQYTVYNGGNPWGMMLRDIGIPIPTEFDDILDELVPVPMPGEKTTKTIGGRPIPTPRELQDIIFDRLGWTVPTFDPDVNQDTLDRLLDDTSEDDSTTAPPTDEDDSTTGGKKAAAVATSAAETTAAETTAAGTTATEPTATVTSPASDSTLAEPTTGEPVAPAATESAPTEQPATEQQETEQQETAAPGGEVPTATGPSNTDDSDSDTTDSKGSESKDTGSKGTGSKGSDSSSSGSKDSTASDSSDRGSGASDSSSGSGDSGRRSSSDSSRSADTTSGSSSDSEQSD